MKGGATRHLSFLMVLFQQQEKRLLMAISSLAPSIHEQDYVEWLD